MSKAACLPTTTTTTTKSFKIDKKCDQEFFWYRRPSQFEEQLGGIFGHSLNFFPSLFWLDLMTFKHIPIEAGTKLGNCQFKF